MTNHLFKLVNDEVTKDNPHKRILGIRKAMIYGSEIYQRKQLIDVIKTN